MSRKYWKRHGHGCGWHGGSWGRSGAASTAWGEGGFGGRNFRILSGLRRDPYRGKVAGVCAGIAGYYGLNLKLIRIAMIISVFFVPFLTIGGYALATFLIKPLPEPAAQRPDGGQPETNAGSSERQAEREQAAEERLPPELRFAALKDKFRELEERTGDMETLVTSNEFRLRRDFKNMHEGKDEGGRSTFGAGPNGRPPMMGLIG
jgi:phage shock protein C